MFAMFCFVKFVFCFYVGSIAVTAYKLHPDTNLSIEQMIQKYGYPVETHEVITEDGYIITMFRIPHGRQGSGVNRKPVLLVHGLLGQAENYVISGMVNASLAYYLADRNFDVWLGNARGNGHARRHKTLDPNEKRFWNFSYHEIAIYDLPKQIDYVLEISKKKGLFFIGHSQAGSCFYILTSEKPEYQKKIIMASLLAPSGFMGNFSHPFYLPLAKIYKFLEPLVDIGLHELPPGGWIKFLGQLCQEDFIRELCVIFYYSVFIGRYSTEFEREMLPLVVQNAASIAARQLLHYAQAIVSGHFGKYDWGPQRNMQEYGSVNPPDYALKNITVPIAIYYCDKDRMVNSKDVDYICEVLPNCVRKLMISNPEWSHYDFVFGKNARKTFHVTLLKFMNKYDKG